MTLLAVGITACVGKTSLGEYDDDDGGDSASTGDADSGTRGGNDDAGGSGDSGETPEACGLSPDPGDCLAHNLRYYFDHDEGRCLPFVWGGCGGVVPFATLGDCESSCHPCDAFSGPPPGPSPAEIVLENHTDEVLFVDAFGGAAPDCFGGYPFRVSTDDLVELELELVLGCREHCSDVARVCELPDCPAICLSAPLVRLDPGGSHTVPWSAITYRQTRLPGSCAQCDADETVLECVRSEPLEPGVAYRFDSIAGTLVCDGPDCEGCEPGPEGSCVVEHGGDIVPTTPASTVVTWGDALNATLIFE